MRRHASDLGRSPDDLPPVATRPWGGAPDDPRGGRHATPNQNKNQNNNQNLTDRLVDVVGEKFVEAGKPPTRSRKNQAPAPEAGDAGRFEEFWNNYPDRKNYPNFQYKTEAAKLNCRNAYVKLRKTWQDNAPAFDEKVLSSLELWKRSEQWNKCGGRFINAPINYLCNGRWEEDPTPRDPAEQQQEEIRKAKLDEIQNDPKAWELCEERCANIVDGKCTKGVTIPPSEDIDRPHPPEECPYYTARSQHSTPPPDRPCDELDKLR